MKTILTSTAIAAIALIGIYEPADAGQVCTTDLLGTGFNYCQETHGTGNQVTAYDGLEFPGIAVTPAEPTVDDNGDASTTDKTFNGFAIPTAQAYGHNATAVGNGSRVGRFVEEVVAVPASCDVGAVNQAGDGCVEDGAVFTPAVEHVPAHTIPADNGTAIGSNAVVEHKNSTALGAGAQSTDDHQVTLGTKDETIRAEGIASAKSKARQQGPVEVVTSDSGGRLATDGGEIFSRLGSLEGANAQQWNQINANSDAIAKYGVRLEDAEKSIAIATAMPDAWLSDSKSFGVFGSVGGTGNETAVGFAAIGRIDETWSVNGKLGADVGFDQFGWQLGAGAQW